MAVVIGWIFCGAVPGGGSTARADETLSITLSGNARVQLRLQGVANKNYLIRSTDNLAAGGWTTLASGATDAAGSFQVSDPSASVPARFYQGVRLAGLQPGTDTLATVAGGSVFVALAGNDPLNPGGALTAIITQLPADGTLQQFDGTPITAVGTVVTDGLNRVRFVPAANSPGSTSFAYELRRESDGVTSPPQTVAVSLAPNWVYSSFDDSSQQLQLAYSLDGVHWSETDALYAPPTGDGVRDSSIVKLNGVYYVASTAGYFGGVDYVQICRSTDLVHWTYLGNVSTAAPGYGGYSWAPEWFVDRDGTVYLYLARPDGKGHWQLFFTTPTCADLTAWNPIQKSEATCLAGGPSTDKWSGTATPIIWCTATTGERSAPRWRGAPRPRLSPCTKQGIGPDGESRARDRACCTSGVATGGSTWCSLPAPTRSP